jgi:SH3-like domain-containing protein
MRKYISILVLLICSNLYANKGPVTNLDMPRFVSLKSNDVNLRVGPSVNYPIELKYTQNNLPVEIIDEFDVWRKIKDSENNIGWLHKSLIKGERYILTGYKNEKEINLYNRPNGKIIGIIKKNNILDLKMCIINWCKVSQNKIKGWLLKKNVWGVYDFEIYNTKFYQPIINQYWKILDSKIFK